MLLSALLVQAFAASIVLAGEAPRSNKRARRTVQDVDNLLASPAAPAATIDHSTVGAAAAAILASLATGTSVFPGAPTPGVVARQLPGLPALPLPEIPGVSTDILASLALPTSPAGLLSAIPVPTGVLALLPRQLPDVLSVLPVPAGLSAFPIPTGLIPAGLPALPTNPAALVSALPSLLAAIPIPLPTGVPALPPALPTNPAALVSALPSLLAAIPIPLPLPTGVPALPVRRRQVDLPVGGGLASAVPVPSGASIPDLTAAPVSTPAAVPTAAPALPTVPVVGSAAIIASIL
ncbi:hypothetical protein RQP46_005603 [Phenoliferia psychrophenolica]